MTDLDKQIEQMQAMAQQHYPEDAEKRLEYLNGLLLQRLREYHSKFVRLDVREVPDAK